MSIHVSPSHVKFPSAESSCSAKIKTTQHLLTYIYIPYPIQKVKLPQISNQTDALRALIFNSF